MVRDHIGIVKVMRYVFTSVIAWLEMHYGLIARVRFENVSNLTSAINP